VSSSAPLLSVSRFFKADPHRDFFRVLADSLDDAVLVVSGDGKRVLASNHSFLLLSGFTRAELDTLNPVELFPDESGANAFGQILESLSVPESRMIDVPLRTRQGSIALLDLESRPLGTGRYALLITARAAAMRQRRNERERAAAERLGLLLRTSSLFLEESVESHRLAMEQAGKLLSATIIGVYRVSANGPDYLRDGPLPEEFPATLALSALDPLRPPTLWATGQRTDNPLQRAARTLGLAILRTCPLGTPTAWIGVLLAAWRQAEDMPEDAAVLMELVAHLCHAGINLAQQRMSLSIQQGRVIQLEGQLREESEAVSDGLLALDESFKIERANEAAGLLLGYHIAELEGMAIQDALVGPDDLMGTLLAAAGHSQVADQRRVTIHRRDGTPFPIHLRAVPLAASTPPRLLLVLSDQSKQQAIEDQSEVLSQRALLGELTAIFAHEVRNPVNNITSVIQYAGTRLGAQHALYPSLDTVLKECERIDRLVTDMLFFARPLQLKFEPLDLGEVTTRLLNRWKPRLKQAGVQYHANFEPSTPKALADLRTLEQVMVNLVTNALQAMPEGGMISITIGPAESEQGMMAEMRIADTGHGISPELMERVFDPFWTTKKDGTGLGLAISRRIINAHKGTLTVNSFPDAGTVFTLRLPSAGERV